MTDSKTQSTNEPIRGAQLLHGRQAAVYLGISHRMVEKLAARGDIPKVRVGRAVRYHIPDLDAYIQRRKALEGQ